MADTETLYCVNHPTTETFLRCNKCDDPICVKCAVQTPTGYRCRNCVRGQQKIFNTAQPLDYLLAPVIAAVLSLIGSYIVMRLGFFTLLVSPFVGMVIDRAVRLVIKNRRSNSLFILIAAGAALGSLPLVINNLRPILSTLGSSNSFFNFLPLIYRGAYTVIVTSAVYYRLKGITL